MLAKSLAPPGVIENRAIDEARPLRVVCIGAGISGILTTIRFPHKLPNVELQVYEKNSSIGGTWTENRYPGCACDIPAPTYQPTFEPNLEWKQFYASADEIREYWERIADKYDCMRYIKLKNEVVHACWDAEQSKWILKIRDLETGSTFEDSCNVLISATGSLNNWKWPAIPGLGTFGGKLLHSASWDQSYDYTGDNVAVIGNGSSGIQIVPSMLPKVKRIDHYARGRTWISATFAKSKVEERGADLDNFYFTEEDHRSFKNDPGVYQKFRKDVELELQSAHGFVFKDSPAQKAAQENFTRDMRKRLARKPELADQLIPSFPPCCRRLTPGPGYLEALCDDKVEVIRDDIAEVTTTGITTTDGKHRKVDTIVCATGFDTTFVPRFPIIGENGILLSERWRETPETYLSLATDGFPNYFISLGPNGALGTGSLILVMEKMIDYFVECVAKMQRESIKSMMVREDAVKRFTKYCDSFFQQTVYSVKCRSWYKSGTEDGRVNALWPGSSLHAVKAVSHPRWEDYRYGYVNDNPGGWIGDSWTQDEKDNTINVDYLDDEAIDFPPVPPKLNGKKLNGSGIGANGS